MIRVAIETSTARGSVAVGDGDRVLAEVALGIQRRHAETALPALEAALRLADVDRRAIEGVVVGAGPGSFTGVRVAGATAKGLVAALDVPLLAYSSLLALVAGAPAVDPVCGLFDARRGEVYGGCWRVGPDGVTEELAPRVGTADEVVRAAAAALGDGAPLCIGDGALRYRERLEAAGARVSVTPAHPTAGSLLWLAARHPELGVVTGDAASWEPRYVRASSAERGIAG